jgi:16S rRNA (guanine966-N2)-methyltransferase
MRVVAGLYGGRRLTAPRGIKTRPTADRVREALFSILFDVEGLTVLDLFAGTGAIGIEALSRGASHATFVEHDEAALRALEKNIASLQIPRARYAVMADRVEHAMATLSKRSAKLDLIYADPPYGEAQRWLPGVLSQSEGLLSEGGRIVVELSDTGPLPEAPVGLARSRTKSYGETVLAFYERV